MAGSNALVGQLFVNSEITNEVDSHIILVGPDRKPMIAIQWPRVRAKH
jgi:hypothetical protein